MNLDRERQILCLKRDGKASDGTRISGHSYVAMYAVLHRDIMRLTMIDVCSFCGAMSASYTDELLQMAERYRFYRKVGDPRK